MLFAFHRFLNLRERIPRAIDGDLDAESMINVEKILIGFHFDNWKIGILFFDIFSPVVKYCQRHGAVLRHLLAVDVKIKRLLILHLQRKLVGQIQIDRRHKE